MFVLKNINVEQAASTFTTSFDFTAVTGSNWELRTGSGGSPGSNIITSKIYTLPAQAVGYNYGNPSLFLWLYSQSGYEINDIYGADAQAGVSGSGASVNTQLANTQGHVRLQIAISNQTNSNRTVTYTGFVNPVST